MIEMVSRERGKMLTRSPVGSSHADWLKWSRWRNERIEYLMNLLHKRRR